MLLTTLVPIILATVSGAVPAAYTPHESRQIFDGLTLLNDVLFFDAPGFPDPANRGRTSTTIQAFVSRREIDLSSVLGTVTDLLSAVGLPGASNIKNAQDRLKLLGALGLGGKEFKFKVNGCSDVASAQKTGGLPDLGMGLSTVSLGTCNAGAEFKASIEMPFLDTRKVEATIFNSPDSGFGVISDIDDTVKISNTLDKVKLIKSTLLDDPKPVAGMPQFYASLKQSLDNPSFTYITGSPFQLYPFLRDFIATSYPQTRGPILMQNLTLINIPELTDFIRSEGVQEYKVEMIERTVAQYPNKKFVTIGDSTQKDPETYAEVFRKHGAGKFPCILIRRVDGADNSAARFDAAFKDVPKNNFRVFTDNEIAGLANINAKGGSC